MTEQEYDARMDAAEEYAAYIAQQVEEAARDEPETDDPGYDVDTP